MVAGTATVPPVVLPGRWHLLSLGLEVDRFLWRPGQQSVKPALASWLACQLARQRSESAETLLSFPVSLSLSVYHSRRVAQVILNLTVFNLKGCCLFKAFTKLDNFCTESQMN